MGYRIGGGGNFLGLAWKTWANHFGKIRQLYEQNASKECVAGYVKRWLVWVRSGVEIELGVVIEQGLGSEMGRDVVGLFGLYRLYFARNKT